MHAFVAAASALGRRSVTLADAFCAYACTLSRRLLDRFSRRVVVVAANDNGGAA